MKSSIQIRFGPRFSSKIQIFAQKRYFTDAIKELVVFFSFAWNGKVSPIFFKRFFRSSFFSYLKYFRPYACIFFHTFFLFASSSFVMSCRSFTFVSIFNLFESSFGSFSKPLWWKRKENTAVARQSKIMVIVKWRFAPHANTINR